MNFPGGGTAAQIYSPQFDRRFFSLAMGMQQQIQREIDELGCNLRGYFALSDAGCGCLSYAGWRLSDHLSIQFGKERVDFACRWESARRL